MSLFLIAFAAFSRVATSAWGWVSRRSSWVPSWRFRISRRCCSSMFLAIHPCEPASRFSCHASPRPSAHRSARGSRAPSASSGRSWWDSRSARREPRHRGIADGTRGLCRPRGGPPRREPRSGNGLGADLGRRRRGHRRRRTGRRVRDGFDDVSDRRSGRLGPPGRNILVLCRHHDREGSLRRHRGERGRRGRRAPRPFSH